jgi:segregation and condensation protein B
MGRRARAKEDLDTELADLPSELRWREWMGRVEAVIFAAPEPVSREILARVVGPDCNLDLIIDDIRAELRGRPYELVSVAGGWQHRTKKGFAGAIRAYFQPITRAELSAFFGKEVSRDVIGHLRALGFITAGPRSPTPGAPYTFVTTKAFLSHYGFDTLRDLPDMEMLEDAGLLSKDKLLADGFPDALGAREITDDGDDAAAEADAPQPD